MTPLLIEIMLHYYTYGNEFRGGNFSDPAVAAGIEDMIKEGMLSRASVPTHTRSTGTAGLSHSHTISPPDDSLYITDRGRLYVEQLCAVPLPVSTGMENKVMNVETAVEKPAGQTKRPPTP